MQIELPPSDGVPIYLQLIRQIQYLVATGRLNAGDQLPSVRKLSEQLMVNPNTVVRAFRELELAGLLVTRPGSGVYVSETAAGLSRREQQQTLIGQVDALITEARHLDLGVEQFVQLVRQRWRAVRPVS